MKLHWNMSYERQKDKEKLFIQVFFHRRVIEKGAVRKDQKPQIFWDPV